MPGANAMPDGIPGGSLNAILESITDGLIVVDRSWRYQFVNRSAERFLARNREELLGRTIWEAFPPLSNSEVEREYRRALTEGVSVHFEYYYEPLASWFDIRAYPSPEGLTIYLQVIDDRKAAQEALEARARQQAAVASMGLEMLRSRRVDHLLDEVTRVVAETLDVEYAKVLKLLPERDELLLQAGIGWQPGSIGTVVIPGGAESQAGFTMRHREPVIVTDLSMETRFQGPALLVDHGVVSGMSVVIEGSRRPFGILGAHTTRRRTFSRDDVHFLQAMANLLAEAAERQEMEAALRGLAKERAARDAAQAAVRARDETLAVVSHDLRAPLQAILGGVSFLQQDALSPGERREHLTVIERNVERTRRLLDDLLEVSSIQSGHLKLKRRPVGVAQMLDNVQEMFLGLAAEREIRLGCDLATSVAVLADEQRLFQALSNLVDNALKHTPPLGAVTLNCVVREDMAELSVADTGPGIPTEELPHVFEWYWQANRQKSAGAGLGLAVARGIVEAHGGRIWAVSEPGQGTTFRLTVPLAVRPASDGVLASSVPRKLAEGRARRSTR